jgi:hypothetical protein
VALNCPFLGSTYTAAQDIQHNPLLLHQWIKNDNDIPLTFQLHISPTENEPDLAALKRSRNWRYRLIKDGKISQICTNIQIGEISNLIGFIKEGCVLEEIPCVYEDCKVIEIGFLIDPNRSWQLIGTNEQIMSINGPFGMIIPQCTMEAEEIINITTVVAQALLRRDAFGYFTYQCIAWRESEKLNWSVSTVFPFLSMNILKASALAVKCKLTIHATTLKLNASNEIHCTFPHLSKLELTNDVKFD